MSRATRENLQAKLDAFRTALVARRHRYSGTQPELDPLDDACDNMLVATIDTILETHALVEALAAKKGVRR